MSTKQTKYSTCKVLDSKGHIHCFLSAKDEEQGVDIQLDIQGYKVIAL